MKMTPRTTTSLLATLLAACLVLAPVSNAALYESQPDAAAAAAATDSDSSTAIDQEHRNLLKQKKQIVNRQTDCDPLKTEEDEEAGFRQLSYVRSPNTVKDAFAEAMERGGYGVADAGSGIHATVYGKKAGGDGGKKGGYGSMSMHGKKGGYDSSMSMHGKKGGYSGKKGGYDMSMNGKKGGYGGGKKGGYGDDDDDDDTDTDSGIQSPTDPPVDCSEPEPTTCEPAWDEGDNPCLPGCGHGTIANPFNPNAVEAEKEQRPAPCKNYSCVCADSGCGKSWDVGCIKWYMQCQTETQVCGSLDSAPTAVQEFNIGSSCALAPTSANTEVCFNRPVTPAPSAGAQVFPPTPGAQVFPPSGDDDDDSGEGGKKGGKKGGYDYSMSMHGKKGGYGGKKAGYDSSMSLEGKKAGGKKTGYGGGKKAGYDSSMSLEGKKAGGKKTGYGGGKKAGYDSSMSMEGKKAGGGKKTGAGGKKTGYVDAPMSPPDGEPLPVPGTPEDPVLPERPPRPTEPADAAGTEAVATDDDVPS